MTALQFTIVSEPAELIAYLPAIQSLGDEEKETLGFLPARAYEEAVARRRLLAATTLIAGRQAFAAYLLFSGVFPHAKVQQIAATPVFRRHGAASALVRALTSELERKGYLSIKADIASDLSSAQAFYERHGFEFLREKPGGAARNRKIRVYSKTLESDTLFGAALSERRFGIEVIASNANSTPIFAFDLNVYFDLVRDRKHSSYAKKLFGEALGHTLRLAVADEFVSELRKTSKGLANDPLLQLALQLPRLPKPDEAALEPLAEKIHEIIFVSTGHREAGSGRARSDARHVAHAALAKATAFVTQDGAILNARMDLLKTFGIDVATIPEVVDLLPAEAKPASRIALRSEIFSSFEASLQELTKACQELKTPALISKKLSDNISSEQIFQGIILRVGDRTVGLGGLVIPRSIDPLAQMMVYVRHEASDAEVFADYLIETLVRGACERTASSIELVHSPGQSIVNRLAAARGFYRRNGASSYTKIAIGKPLTAANWDKASLHIRRRTNLVLPEHFSSLGLGTVEVTLPVSTKASIAVNQLEDLLGPTLILWPGRDGVIVPIARQYADELLGTSDQQTLGFVINKKAAFLSIRGYVNSPRAAKSMRPGMPIVFYESKRSQNGRGAAIAVGRIVNSVIVSKAQIATSSNNRIVIDDAAQFSATKDVLLTTFDNIMPFPQLVPLARLRELNAVGKANLISAQVLTCDQLTAVLTDAWAEPYVR